MRAGRLVPAGAILAGLILAARVPAHAQRLGGGGGPEISLVRVLAALALCIAAAFALALLISRRGVRGRLRGLARLQGASRIAVIESRRISPHADLCLVRCGGRDYLLACGAGGIRLLSESASGEGA